MALKDVIIGYAKGDKGDKGDTGERGATGQTGPQGEPGNIADAAITDTQGLDVAKGAKTTAQKLFDAIADRIVNKLVTNDTLTTKLADYLLKSAMSSTNIDSTTNVPTSALVYSLMQDVNNNLSNRNPPYAEKTSGAPYGLPNFSYVIGSAGNKKGTASGDVYYIAVNSNGRLYGGTQVNNATDITWEETATKDDLGVFLTASGTKAAVFNGYVEITNLKLYAGHTYLVLGKTGSSISVSLISARVVSPSSEYGSAFNFLESRTTGSNGGGCVTAAIITLTKDYTVPLQGYGYDNATYDYSGLLMAIQLK